MKQSLIIFASIFFIFTIGIVSPISWSGGGGSNTTTFLELTDTPSTYSGQAGLVATVNPGEDALIFSASGGGGGITNISQAGDVNVSGIADDDVLRWDDAVKMFIASKMNSILTFGNDFLFFSANNEITFNETRLNDTIESLQTNISITYGTNVTDEIPILLTASGKQIIVMNGISGFTNEVNGSLNVNGNISLNGSVALYFNATCTFLPSPSGLVVMEVCN